ncbi:VCBS repeat-containing protein [Flavobacteriaceae bacterium F89]|uniref:VCBS repeat-containing protein n=1 Tax=Cerina litoralis TaxID=2874477 RepID=A0AAE3EXS2_9FLAO|nr:VCBS repeat-containing protein [Cerina litoralis]MCG2461662.1 VCBS repeat-containing protein [Cerina litoralis]
MFLRKYIRIPVLLGFVGSLYYGCDRHNPNAPLFELLDSAYTHVDFENTLSTTDSINILDFEYMFNGGGVGIGDINNDGLQDIYFSGNQVTGRLYLNRDDFKFKDVTESSGVMTTGWSNGVSMTDVNQDGLIDLYVCRGGPRNTPENDMANLLYINNGDGSFKEVAKEFGIADTGYSIQAVFFDCDKDGDKDLYLLTNALVPYNRNTSRPKMDNGQAASTDRLYINNGDNTFTDKSKEAGITLEGFGLGIAICDANEDGWPDLYISNDFLTNDILYINNGDGTFSDKIADYLKHQSLDGMGNDIADINNDGHMDIMVLDMLPQDNKRRKENMGYFSYDKAMLDLQNGYMPQYVRNTLQLNNGNGTFSEIGQLSGIHNTDWSWSPLIADFDNDGWKDMFITNGYRRDVSNLDFINYGQQNSFFGTKKAMSKNRLKKLFSLPEIKLHNYIYKNNGDLTFSDRVKEWGFSKPSFSNGAAYADLDNDGDLDLIVSNIDDKAFIYRNNSIKNGIDSKNINHFLRLRLVGDMDLTGTRVSLKYKGKEQYQLYSPVKGYLSTVEEMLHFGLGKTTMIDTLLVKWPNGTSQLIKNVNADQVFTVDSKNARPTDPLTEKSLIPLFDDVTPDLGINYTNVSNGLVDFNIQATLIRTGTQLGSGIAIGDINNDGLEDVYVGGSKTKKGSLYLQSASGIFTERVLDRSKPYDNAGTLFMDADGDGDLDLFIVNGGGLPDTKTQQYTDRLYINDGFGNFEAENLLQRNASGSCISAADFDKDGDLDLFIGGRVRVGSYPLPPKSYLLENKDGEFIDSTESVFGNTGEFGMVSDALWTDFDNDKWIDLILVGEFMQIKFYKNEKGKLRDITKNSGLKNTGGWWNSIVPGDFDMDGDVDYIVGNSGLNSMYTASVDEPITLYAKDFDSNGSIDPIMSCYTQGKEHLIHSRDVLIHQINAMRARFKTYESYATASMGKTFLPEELEDALILKAQTLASSYIENLGQGKFKISPLPIKAQFAPIFGMQVDDYNNDGFLDVMAVGNLYGAEAFSGRFDAMTGLCMLGDGTGKFKCMRPLESGLKVGGDAKGIASLESSNGNTLVLIGKNSGPLQVYTYKGFQKNIPLKENEAYAMIHLKDGKVSKQEFAYGGSYLGHSSRTLKVEVKQTDFVEIYSYTGESRKILYSDE